MIKYGVIGNNLSHSYAPVVHNMFFNLYSIDGNLEKLEIQQDEFDKIDMHEFLRGFKGVNVSAPYKTQIMSHIDEVDDEAREIGSINTINNVNGKLIGYNTDAKGFAELLEITHVKPKGKTFVILSAGGTARSVVHAIKKYAKDIVCVSKDLDVKIDGARIVSFESLPYLKADILVDATPVGMYPNIDEQVVDDSIVANYETIIDLVYNPVFTKLLQSGLKQGKYVVSGLYMLVSQAVQSQSIWQGVNLQGMIKRIFSEATIHTQMQMNGNIYIIGMLGCGKTELGKALAKEMKKDFIDLDDMIIKMSGKTIKELYDEGEEVFRAWETKALAKVAFEKGKVIALGCGAVLNKINLAAVKASGIVILRDRSMDKILSTFEMGKYPNVNSREDVIRIYNERYPRYVGLADYIVPFGDVDLDVKKIAEVLK